MLTRVQATLASSFSLAMASGRQVSRKLQVFHDFKERIEAELEDKNLSGLIQEFQKSRVILKEAKEKFDCLDHDHVDDDVKVRYLVQNIYDMLERDDKVFDNFIKVLKRKVKGSSIILCDEMNKILDKGEGSYPDVFLTDKDVPALTEMLMSGSHKWKEIALATGLPEYISDDCGKGSSNSVRLSNVLIALTKGGYGGSAPPTLSSLKAILSGKTVGLPRLAESLNAFTSLSESSKPNSSCKCPEITYCSIDTEVVEGRSTLLEVQVSSDVPVCYQWRKDGKAISDGPTFSGVSNSILYVARASIKTQGIYSCSVTSEGTSNISEELELTVKLSLEKEPLLEVYLSANELISEESWPPVSSNTFHTLILHSREDHSHQYATIQEDADQIMEKKSKVSYEEAFSDIQRGSLILVEGRPGSGKTTLAHKLVKDWAKGELVLQNMKLVYLITLRALKESDALKDWLSLYYSDADFLNAIVKRIETNNGKDIAFVLDGLDEYPFRNNEQNLVHKLLYDKYLRSSVVVVTSRPIALTSDLKKLSKRNIEVVGFNQENILDYIMSYPFESLNGEATNMSLDLIAYVQKHESVLHMCYLPLHAAIICFLFSELKGKIPDTETQIYEQFIIATILRKKMKHDKSCTLQITSLKDTEASFRESFLQVCSLAFNMTINSSQVISKAEALVSLPADLNSGDFFLGLLTVQKTPLLSGFEELYAFHHLSMQEYLAAYHITELDDYEQELVIREYGGDDEEENMWKFFFGIKQFSDNLGNIWGFLSTSESNTIKVLQYAFESQQTNVCSYAVQCNNNMLVFGNDTITHSDFFAMNYVISVSLCLVSKLKFVDSEFDKNAVTSLDHKALEVVKELSFSIDDYDDFEQYEAYNALLTKLSFLEVLDLKNNRLNEETLAILSKDVMLPHLKILKVDARNLKSGLLNNLKFGSKKIEQVYIKSSSLQKLAMAKTAVSNVLGFEAYLGNYSSLCWYNNTEVDPHLCCVSLTSFVEIALINCDISDDQIKLLGAGFKNSLSLVSIELDFNQISNCGALFLSDSIATLKSVAVVSLQCNSIGDAGATALAQCLEQNQNLRRFDLQGNLLSDEGAVAVAKAMNRFPQLEIYLCNVNITQEGVQKIHECNSHAVVEESISNSFSWEAIVEGGQDAVAKALKCGKCPFLNIVEHHQWDEMDMNECCKNIKTLRITEEVSMTMFTRILKNASVVEKIDISFHGQDILSMVNEICPETITPPLSVTNGFLQALCLSHCSIDSAYISHILSVLQDLKSLKKLDVSHNCIASINLLELCIYCGKLKELDFAHNNLRFDGSSDDIWDMDIQELNLSHNELSICVPLLNTVLVHCRNLVNLDISNNCLGSGIEGLIEGMTLFGTLETLALESNNIGSDSVHTLAAIVSINSNLKLVNFCQNNIVADGAELLSAAFSKCKHLVSLNLSNNILFAEGVGHLLGSLNHCLNLKSLYLNETGLEGLGITALADFQCGTNLEVLDLSQNALSFNTSGTLDNWEDYEELPEELLSSLTYEETFGVQYLASALTYCLNLKQLYLRDVEIDMSEVELIASSLKLCHALEYLDVSYNESLSSEGVAILVEKLQRPSKLTLDITSSVSIDCGTALLDGESCCKSCKKILLHVYSNDFLFLLLDSEQTIPKWFPKLKGDTLYEELENSSCTP